MAKLGPWYRLAAVVLKPFAVTLTGRDWRHQERLPRTGGIIVVANHNSYYDPIVVAHVLHDNKRPPRFLAKSGLFTIPLIGRVLRGCKQIPVYRQSVEAREASLRDAEDAIARGEAVVIYPEGTLTRDPDVWPMNGKSGAARLALASGAPVIPLGQWGANKFLRPYGKVPHFLPRVTVMTSFGEPVDLSDLGQDPTPENIRTATARIMDAITEQVAELRGEPAPTKRTDLPRTGTES